MRSRAFTVIETLVVMAIVLLLAAIITGALVRAKASAKNAACISNLRSIGQAVQMYASSNDGFVPPFLTETWLTDKFRIERRPEAWRAALAPLVGGAIETFYCPFDKVRGPTCSEWFDSTYTSYNILPVGGDQEAAAQGYYRFNLDTARNTVPYLRDLSWIEHEGREWVTYHGKQTNSLYPDGRVKSYIIGQAPPGK